MRIQHTTKLGSRSAYINACRQGFKNFAQDRKIIIYYLRERGDVIGHFVPRDEEGKPKLDAKGEFVIEPRLSRGTPYGVLVAFNEGNQIFVGSNLCTQETFYKSISLVKAVNNAVPLNKTMNMEGIPVSIQNRLPKFLARVNKYFKVGQAVAV